MEDLEAVLPEELFDVIDNPKLPLKSVSTNLLEAGCELLNNVVM